MANPKFLSDAHPNDLWGVTAPSGVLTMLDRSEAGYPCRLNQGGRDDRDKGNNWAQQQNTLHFVDWARKNQLRDGHPYPERYWRLIGNMRRNWGQSGLMVRSRTYRPPAPGPAFRLQLRGSRPPAKPVNQS